MVAGKLLCYYILCFNFNCLSLPIKLTKLILCVLSRFSCVWLLVTTWTIACQALLSVGFSRQGHWNGLPCPPPGDLLTQGSDLCLLRLLHWQAGSLLLSHRGSPMLTSVTDISGCLCTDKSHGSLTFFPFLNISLCVSFWAVAIVKSWRLLICFLQYVICC